jgi:hypothetical protein
LINKIKYRLVVSARKHYILYLATDRIVPLLWGNYLNQCQWLPFTPGHMLMHSYYNCTASCPNIWHNYVEYYFTDIRLMTGSLPWSDQAIFFTTCTFPFLPLRLVFGYNWLHDLAKPYVLKVSIKQTFFKPSINCKIYLVVSLTH